MGGRSWRANSGEAKALEVDGAEGVGVEDAAGAGGAVDVEETLDGLVDAGAVDPGVGDGVGGGQFQEDVGPVVDEALGEAVVEALGEAVALAVEFVGEHASVGVGQGGHGTAAALYFTPSQQLGAHPLHPPGTKPHIDVRLVSVSCQSREEHKYYAK